MPEQKQPTKVVNKEYLYDQFKLYYEQVVRPDIESLESQLVKATMKLNRMSDVLSAHNIEVDFSDIDNA